MILKHIKNGLAFLLGLLIALVILETVLQLYNPFGSRLKGNKIVLLSGRKLTFENDRIMGVDSIIEHSKNALGFRGSERPADIEKWTSILAVGGSTTECLYQSDGKDWVSLLGNQLSREIDKVWINNAGLDGHSTFGHQILLEDYLIKLKPNYILYLVGCNDMERDDLGEYDKKTLRKENSSWDVWLFDNSQIASFLKNIHRNHLAKKKNLSHYYVPSFQNLGIVDSINQGQIDSVIKSHNTYLLAYEKRLEKLIRTTVESGIQPVLVTQPTLVGYGIDEPTTVDLAKIKLCHELGGKCYWKVLEAYNEVSRKIAKNNQIPLIDLSVKMPKSTDLFYDCFHYTNQGAEVVSEILFEEMRSIVRSVN